MDSVLTKRINGKPIRTVWNTASSSFLYSATDLVATFTDSENPRIYWNVIKRRYPQLKKYCKTAKLQAADGKKYNSDVIPLAGITELIFTIRTPNRKFLRNWIKGPGSIDEQSKRLAYELWDSGILDSAEVGTTESLKRIHAFMFEGLYSHAGKIRNENMTRDDFTFVKPALLIKTLDYIDHMSDNNFDEILDKYVEMNIAHPFFDGNGRAMRIWLDALLKNKIGKVVNWSKVKKEHYLTAMKESTKDSSKIKRIIKRALTTEIYNREIYLSSVDTSYYYEMN